MPKYRFDEIAINSTAKKKPVEEDKYTYLGLEHLDSGSLKVTRFGSDVAPIGEKLLMKKGDVLFGKRRAYQKKVAIAPFDGIFSAHGMVLRPKEEVIDKDFFPLFISSDYFLDAAIKISVGSLSPTINWRDLKGLEFELPSLEEQKRLAEVLWSINNTLDAYKKLLETTDQLVKSQFIEMFGVAETNSKGLNQCNMEDICEGITDGSHTPPKGIDYSEYLMLSSKNIINDCITVDEPRYLSEEQFESENKRTRIKAGDVLLTIVGTVGRTAVVPEEHPNMTLQRSVCVLHPKKDVILSKFLFYELKCMQGYIDSLAQGAAQRGIYLGQVAKLQVVVPPIENQKRFVSFLEQSDKSKFELEQSILELTATYKRIIADNLG